MDLPTLKAAYDPERLRREGHQIVDLLADYLAGLDRGAPVLPQRTPDEQLARWPGAFPAQPQPEALLPLLSQVLRDSHHLHHPRYVGHQVTAPVPLLALLEAVAALLNNGMAVYEMGPVATAMERQVLRYLAAQLGFGGGADGFLTSGGSAGNLTALLAARQARAAVWDEGYSGPPLCVLASEQSHYCVARAVKIMGLGAGGIVPVPVDERFRLRAEALPEALARAERAGRRAFCVAASAASTATGAYDPLPAIADFCQAHGLWLHVDGAHGAAAALSPRHRYLVDGIERADSLVLDAHKMLLTPALCTAVLFRDGQDSFGAFAQRASYLLPEQSAWYDGAARTLECTKRMMSLKLYLGLQVLGTQVFGDYVGACYDLAQRFAALLQAAPDFELALPPQCNIVCFRHRPPGQPGLPRLEAEALDQHQAALRARVVHSGAFYLVQTRLPTGIFLRTTLINPLTEEPDLVALLDALRAAAR